MDIQKLINEKTTLYVKEKMPAVIEKHLATMMDEVISDIFGRYGDNAKEIKKIISEKIKIDLTDLTLMDYNGMLATTLQNHFNHLAQERSCKPVLDLLSQVV